MDFQVEFAHDCWQLSRYELRLTFSGRLLASAILLIGSADVLDAKIQCSGMYCKQQHESVDHNNNHRRNGSF